MKTRVSASAFALAALLLAAAGPAFGAAQIVIVNVDGPNEGFNDPTPAAPVGGNPGTTLGEQRLIAFQFAADVWGSILDSAAPIRIQASFDPLPCAATGGTLGAAGALQIFANFPGAELPGTWYHSALADKLAGADLGPAGNDLVAFFNADLDNPVCLGSRGWYYGLDNDHGTDIDLVVVLLHEFGHGLGFANFINERNGRQIQGLPDVFSVYTLDTATGKYWPQMTDAERVASAINSNRVVWDGIHTTAAVPSTLQPGVPLLTVNAPSGLGPFRVGAAAFGAPLSAPGVSGDLVLAHDADEDGAATTFTATDGCSPIIEDLTGRVALVDRGGCSFVVKVKNAQDAGAVAAVIADNAPGSPPPGLGGSDPTIVIPSARVALGDGDVLKEALAGGAVNVTLGIDLTTLAGADPAGRALLNAPNPLQPGSSISHWDPVASPNLLMEPSISADLPHGVDLALQQFQDIGWFSDGDGVPDGMDACLGSSPEATVVVDGCDSGVANTLFPNGCKVSDLIGDCAADASNHDDFVGCVANLTNGLNANGTITGAGKGAIQSCAARAALP